MMQVLWQCWHDIGIWLCISELFSLKAVQGLQSASWPHFLCRQETDFREKLSWTQKYILSSALQHRQINILKATPLKVNSLGDLTPFQVKSSSATHLVFLTQLWAPPATWWTKISLLDSVHSTMAMILLSHPAQSDLVKWRQQRQETQGPVVSIPCQALHLTVHTALNLTRSGNQETKSHPDKRILWSDPKW